MSSPRVHPNPKPFSEQSPGLPTRPSAAPAARRARAHGGGAGVAGSKGAGHFGYGLLCEADGAGAGARFECGVHVGARTDPTGARALAELCPEIGSGGDFCGEGLGYTAAHRLTTGAPRGGAGRVGAPRRVVRRGDGAAAAGGGRRGGRARLAHLHRPRLQRLRPLPIAYLVSPSLLSHPRSARQLRDAGAWRGRGRGRGAEWMRGGVVVRRRGRCIQGRRCCPRTARTGSSAQGSTAPPPPLPPPPPAPSSPAPLTRLAPPRPPKP